MIQLFALYAFVLGTLIGSFLNVVALRYNTGKNIFGRKERSMCFSCGKRLAWYELLPVISFIFLRARCAECKSPISWQYPLVELATGFLFWGIFVQNVSGGFYTNTIGSFVALSLLQVIIWSILVVITVYDFKHKIIPDGLVFGFIGLSLVTAFFFPESAGGTLGNSILAAFIFFGFFGGLWLVSGGRWLGFGDAKLVVGVGLLLGVARGVSALALAFWIGAGVSLVLLGLGQLAKHKVIQKTRLRRRLGVFTMKSEIPFAPFIILGTLIAFFWHVDFFGIAGLFLS